jgi:hypothetical protein
MSLVVTKNSSKASFSYEFYFFGKLSDKSSQNIKICQYPEIISFPEAKPLNQNFFYSNNKQIFSFNGESIY